MAGLMENASAALARLSERERRLVLITGAVAVLVLGGGLVLWSQSALDAKRKQVKNQRQQLEQIQSFEEEYKAAEAREKDAINRLKGNNVSLFSRLNQAAQKLGLALKDLNEREVPVKDANVKEIQVEVNVKNLSIDKLNEFIKEIEGERGDELVKVTKLKVKTRFDNDEMLDATLTVATWKQGS